MSHLKRNARAAGPVCAAASDSARIGLACPRCVSFAYYIVLACTTV